MTEQVTVMLPPAAVQLLRSIADHDTGKGLLFENAPRARYRHPVTLRVFNQRSFWPLSAAGLIDIGDSDRDPVRITEAGRAHLTVLDTAPPVAKRRPGSAMGQPGGGAS